MFDSDSESYTSEKSVESAELTHIPIGSEQLDIIVNSLQNCQLKDMATEEGLTGLQKSLDIVLLKLQDLSVQTNSLNTRLIAIENPQTLQNIPDRNEFILTENELKVPDNIANIQNYNGDPKILKFWLQSAEREFYRLPSTYSAERLNYLVDVLISKLTDKARTAVAECVRPKTFEEFKLCLTDAILPHKSVNQLSAELSQIKLIGNNITGYYNVMRRTADQLKIAAQRDPVLNDNWNGVEHYINLQVLGIFTRNSGKYMETLIHQQPQNLEDAYERIRDVKSVRDTLDIENKNASSSENKRNGPHSFYNANNSNNNYNRNSRPPHRDSTYQSNARNDNTQREQGVERMEVDTQFTRRSNNSNFSRNQINSNESTNESSINVSPQNFREVPPTFQNG